MSNSSALVNYDRNRYSVECSVAGKVAAVRAYADRIVVVEGYMDVVALTQRGLGEPKLGVTEVPFPVGRLALRGPLARAGWGAGETAQQRSAIELLVESSIEQGRPAGGHIGQANCIQDGGQ